MPFASSVCQQFVTVTQLSNLVQMKNLAPFKSYFFQCKQRRSNISGRWMNMVLVPWFILFINPGLYSIALTNSSIQGHFYFHSSFLQVCSFDYAQINLVYYSFQISWVFLSPEACTRFPSFLSCPFVMVLLSGVTDTPQNVAVPSTARREGKIRLRSTISSWHRRFTWFVTYRAWLRMDLPFSPPIITQSSPVTGPVWLRGFQEI